MAAQLADNLVGAARPSGQQGYRPLAGTMDLLAPFQRGCSFQMVPGRAYVWAQNMGKPHHTLHFAGEHLRRLEVGMEGAMESGEQAARELAEKLLA